jgi:hypothetical protein
VTVLEEILHRLDTCEAEVTDFEAGVLDTCLRWQRQGRRITPKQRAIVVQMAEKYLPDGATLAAELLGQERLL